jgi:hypothetical protein
LVFVFCLVKVVELKVEAIANSEEGAIALLA